MTTHANPTHLDLFSGIGGFALAAQWTGWETVGFSEVDPYASAVLAKHWPGVPNHGDIRNVRGVQADLVTGGFPCQPFSVSGKRRGAADDRHLWPEMLRVIAGARPRWVLGENVPGIIGMELDGCISDLEGIGYTCQALVVPACAVDARHRRDRVWIVAHANGRSGGEGCNGCTDAAGEGPNNQSERPSCNARDVADAKRGGREAEGEFIKRRRETKDGERKADRPFDGCQQSIWQPEPGVGGGIDGFSAWLDGNGLNTQTHESIMAYAKAKKVGQKEILRSLRGLASSQDVQWEAGGCFSIRPEEILLAYLRKLEKEAADETWLQLEGKEAYRPEVRGVRSANKPKRTSHRPGHHEQRTAEHPNSMQALSRLLAQHSQEAWQSYRWSDAGAHLNPWGDGWEIGTPRTALGIPNRAHRLRGLGNAIVPQVAAQILGFMRAIDEQDK